VVAVRGAAARVDELRHAGVEAGLRHVAGAEDVDLVLALARAVRSRGHHRREVDDGVDAVALEALSQLRIADVRPLVDDAGQSLRLRGLAHVEREDGLDRLRGRESRNDLPADEPGTSRDRDVARRDRLAHAHG